MSKPKKITIADLRQGMAIIRATTLEGDTKWRDELRRQVAARKACFASKDLYALETVKGKSGVILSLLGKKKITLNKSEALNLADALSGRMTTPKQQPGCLPKGYTLDSMLTAEQFCRWQNVSRSWFSARLDRLKGVVKHSQQMVRIHPRSYIEANGK